MTSRSLKDRLLKDDRLDGWKRIAAHLDCDARTAKRWEKGRELPVHRLYHEKQASVYAFASELDQWQRGMRPVPSPRGKRAKHIAVAIGAFLLGSIGTIAWFAWQSREPVPAETGEAFPFVPQLATGLLQTWTDSELPEGNPTSDGRQFTWRGERPSSSELFLWRDGEITQLTDDDRDEFNAVGTGDLFVWLEGDECYTAKDMPKDCAVWAMEDGERFQLTFDQGSEFEPVARDGTVIWQRGLGKGLDIWWYRNGELRQLTGQPWGEGQPVISGDRMVWVGAPDRQADLFEFRGQPEGLLSYNTPGVVQLTRDRAIDRQPSIDGDWTAWVRHDGEDDEIMLSDGESQWRLTDNRVQDVTPQVNAGRVAWVMKSDPITGDGNEIMAFDGARVWQLTDDIHLDWHPAVSEDYIVWHRINDADADIVAVAWDDLAAYAAQTENPP